MASRRRRRSRQPRRGLRLWLVPMGILAGIALLLFAGVFFVDRQGTDGSAANYYVHFDPEKIGDALTGLAGMTAAVLGIVITVVSLLVQLTSERYTGVAQMFLRDRTNIAVMMYYVVTCAVGVATSLSRSEERRVGKECRL